MRRLGIISVTTTGNAPGKSAKSQVIDAPTSSGALAPPVVKYWLSFPGLCTASKTSATGRWIFP